MNDSTSPLIQQYLEIKSQYPNELIFFQVGDFYELFFEDAKIASSILSITLTKRGIYKSEHIPLCGIPVHMVEQYYPKLIKKGYIVIICNQTEPAQTGKLVKRAVVDIITPSSIFLDSIHDNIYSLFISINNQHITLFWFEFSKQEIIYNEYPYTEDGIILFMSSFEKHKPKEIITDIDSISDIYKLIIHKKSIKTFSLNYNLKNIDEFIIKNNFSKIFYTISVLFLTYFENYFQKILNGNSLLIRRENDSDFLFLDNSSIKYLECVNNLNKDSKENSLYELLDLTKTKMGSRLMKKWILYPLNNEKKIIERHDYIDFFLNNKELRKTLQDYLSMFGDIEKLFQRIRLSKIRDKDFLILLKFQKEYIEFKKYIQRLNNPFLSNFILFSIEDDLINLIKDAINNDMELKINEELIIINPSFSSILKEKYILLTNQENAIEKFCYNQIILTGITELTIKKSNLYQYVFELSKIKEKKYTLPDSYIRVQTLTQKERYTSIELQKLSSDIINAQEDYKNEEKKIKEFIINKINQNNTNIYNFIETISLLDVCISLAECASIYHWKKPNILPKGESLKIISGKHPIASNNNFMYVANSLFLDDNKKTYIITGPNMGGKSTFMRQNALLILLTHIGSYIPAEESYIPIMDKILTRVGANDNLHEGKSTFCTELEEIKTIITSANKYSFIIIDEIGRGTSTHDGIAIAASTIKYLTEINSFLLCSTHYNELKDLLTYNTIAWYYMDTIIKNNSILFLYNIIPGISKNSMGIALAKKIGLPESIIQDAEYYHNKLEKNSIFNISNNNNNNNNKYDKTNNENKKKEDNNLIIYAKQHQELIKNEFLKKTIDDISPREAFLILEKIYNLNNLNY